MWSGCPVEAVVFVENLVDGGGRDVEAGSFRLAEVGANAGEHGEFAFEVACRPFVHGLRSSATGVRRTVHGCRGGWGIGW